MSCAQTNVHVQLGEAEQLTFDVTVVERQGEDILVLRHPAHAFAHHVQCAFDLLALDMVDFQTNVFPVRHLESTIRRSERRFPFR